MNPILTMEILQKFGEDDQFQIFYTDTGDRIVGTIAEIRVANHQEIEVRFKEAATIIDKVGDQTRSVLHSYEEAPLDGLVLLRETENGVLISNSGAEQILIFAKASHPEFVEIK